MCADCLVFVFHFSHPFEVSLNGDVSLDAEFARETTLTSMGIVSGDTIWVLETPGCEMGPVQGTSRGPAVQGQFSPTVFYYWHMFWYFINQHHSTHSHTAAAYTQTYVHTLGYAFTLEIDQYCRLSQHISPN